MALPQNGLWKNGADEAAADSSQVFHSDKEYAYISIWLCLHGKFPKKKGKKDFYFKLREK